tara:strand:+ start:66 stop:809 length:744 start_codon:yes stop_codon:yes gene_type:complete
MIKDKFIHLINIKNEHFTNVNLLSWLKHNKDWKCMKWNSKMIINLIKLNYPKIYNYYIKVDENKKKELASYIILFHFGGIYINSDLICLKPLSKLIHFFRKYNVILSKYPNPNFFEKIYYECIGIKNLNYIISNEIMISKKNNYFWKMLLDNIIDMSTKKSTGYVILSNFYFKNKVKFNDIVVANNNFLIPCNKFSKNCDSKLSYSKHAKNNNFLNINYLYYNYFRNIKKLLIFTVFIVIIINIILI